MSILCGTEAVFVTSPSDRAHQDTARCFYLLASGLLTRLWLFEQPSDAQHCIEYFRYLEFQPPEVFGFLSDHVKVYVLWALAFQAKLVIGDATGIVDEMMARFRDILASNIPQLLRKVALSAVVETNDVYALEPEYLNVLIDTLREANRNPDSHDPDVAWQLAVRLSQRFKEAHSMDDYDEAIALFDKVITSDPKIDCPRPQAASALYNSAAIAAERACMYDNPEYFEEAIYCHRKFLRISSPDDWRHRTVSEELAFFLEMRSSRFGITREGIPEPSPDPEVTSFFHLVASLHAGSTIDKTHWWKLPEERAKHNRAFQAVCHTTDITEIKKAIEYCELLVALTPSPNSIRLHPAFALGEVLLHAFKFTDNIEYLNKSIVAFRDFLAISPTNSDRSLRVKLGLYYALATRYNLSKDEKDLDEMIQFSSVVSKDTYVNAPDRLMFSCGWAECARHKQHHTTLTAYETALSLMEDTVLFAPTLETQHFYLVSRRGFYEELPKDMASYNVSRGRLPEAIQALEQGRALIWSEMRGFRTSIHQLALTPHLAEEFTEVNLELERLTTSVSLDINDDNGHEDGEGIDKFGRLAVRHHGLSAKRKELVSQIQALPGLEGFSKRPSFDTLRSAAIGGPVIIVNHSKWRCDILIILHHTHPSLITTPDNFYDRAIKLRNQLVRARTEYLLESKPYQRELRSVLESLHELVGQPVIKELQRLKIPEQSRIWWCPTSVFCSLPLHAMGPTPSDDGVSRYFSDLYIPSYTPTLSTLIESRKTSKMSFEKPSVLLVATPDDSMEAA